jgi:hypothetical protein
MPPANKKWQKDVGEVMQGVVEGLEMQPQGGCDVFGNCAHDHFPFAMIRSRDLSGVGKIGEGSAADAIPPLPVSPLMMA